MDPGLDADQRRESFEHLAAEVVEPLRRYLARRTDPTTAEDVLADVLLVLWRRLNAVPAEALPYAYGVAHNCLANAQRSARRQQRVAARIAAIDPPAASLAQDEDPDERVTAALETLRPAEAELLRLWAWEDLGPTEIATVLDITVNAATIRLHRAKKKLEDAIRKVPGGTGHEQADEGRRP
ncbi:sigma-70 family RNA polymerase sigma factor [Nocardia sp. NBC_00565]|uniref:RNA polymerase sigma factor n=1 Tax=Nocardia sp. NBC_00565 TaxID=2975993 RepID=UPI002E820376|nr:sigma-70 family RNA polymerase sigma factor [Nocardia sp. NBC_00565]WUC03421.1 sigma-70 family RNA polymerase sigma factor [Nocardia sp. NBC_00565]